MSMVRPIPSRFMQAVALLATLALAGCTGDASTLLATDAAPASSGVTTTQASLDRPGFDPFNERSENERTARQVIEKLTRAEVHQPGPLPEFSIGRADAPVTIVKYMSLTCPFCRRFQAETYPVLYRDYIATGKVRLVLREFPIGKASGAATLALRCAPMGSYLALYEKFLAQQSSWVAQEVKTEAIFEVARQVGMTRAEFDACAKNQALIDKLKQVKERGRQLGIIGTPNFFIEDRLVKKVVGIAEIRQLVDPLLSQSGR
jgi:protein-disulfide isomerase